MIARQDVRFKIPASTDGKDITISMVAMDAGDGNDHDFVVWQRPRLVAPGRPDLLLRDVRSVTRDLLASREKIVASTSLYLLAAAEADEAPGQVRCRQVGRETWPRNPMSSRPGWNIWASARATAVSLAGHFTGQLKNSAGYDFINGWGSGETPLLVANSSDQHVRIPGNMKPHSVAVHPSPMLKAAVGWRSPVTSTMKIEASVTHAHPECGNGVTWSLELRRGTTRRRLAAGVSAGGKEVKVGPIESLEILTGDLVSLLIGPRDGNHSCDLTSVQLKLTETGATEQTWNLAADVSGDILTANPHADRLGHPETWHFYAEPEKAGSETGPVIPAGSLLARWKASRMADERRVIAEEVQKLLMTGEPASKARPDALLVQQLRSLSGPLMSGMLRGRTTNVGPGTAPASGSNEPGLDPALFGKTLDGKPIDPASLLRSRPIGHHVPNSGRTRERLRAGDDRRARQGSRFRRKCSA